GFRARNVTDLSEIEIDLNVQENTHRLSGAKPRFKRPVAQRGGSRFFQTNSERSDDTNNIQVSFFGNDRLENNRALNPGFSGAFGVLGFSARPYSWSCDAIPNQGRTGKVLCFFLKVRASLDLRMRETFEEGLPVLFNVFGQIFVRIQECFVPFSSDIHLVIGPRYRNFDSYFL